MSKTRITIKLPASVFKRLEKDASESQRSLAGQLLFECLPSLMKVKSKTSKA